MSLNKVCIVYCSTSIYVNQRVNDGYDYSGGKLDGNELPGMNLPADVLPSEGDLQRGCESITISRGEIHVID